MQAPSWMSRRPRPNARPSSARSPWDEIVCLIAHHARRRHSAKKAPKPRPEQTQVETRRKALGPQGGSGKVVFEGDRTCEMGLRLISQVCCVVSPRSAPLPSPSAEKWERVGPF